MQYVWQSDRISNKRSFDCFYLDINLLLMTYKLLLIYYYNYHQFIFLLFQLVHKLSMQLSKPRTQVPRRHRSRGQGRKKSVLWSETSVLWQDRGLRPTKTGLGLGLASLVLVLVFVLQLRSWSWSCSFGLIDKEDQDFEQSIVKISKKAYSTVHRVVACT